MISNLNSTHQMSSHNQHTVLEPGSELIIHPPAEALLSWLDVWYFTPTLSVGSQVQRGETIGTFSGNAEKSIELISPLEGTITYHWRSGNILRAPREGLIRINPTSLFPLDPCPTALEVYHHIDSQSEELLTRAKAQAKGSRQNTIGFAICVLIINAFGVYAFYTGEGEGAIKLTLLFSVIGVWFIIRQTRQNKARLSKYPDVEAIREALCSTVSIHPGAQ
jgi:hypothetical protein